MPKGVSCSVADCTYWEQGNECSAKSIMIDIDKHAKMQYDAEFADEPGSKANHRDIAGDVGSTCCHTYKSKV